MNHPFPTQLQLRAETVTSRLLADQASDTESFLAIIRQAQAGISELHFPLGSPAHGYDLADITDALADWQNSRDPEQLQEIAEDKVLTMLEGPREEYADHHPLPRVLGRPSDPWRTSGPRS